MVLCSVVSTCSVSVPPPPCTSVQLSLWDWRLRRLVYCYAAALDDWALQLEHSHSVSALSPDGNVLAAGVSVCVGIGVGGRGEWTGPVHYSTSFNNEWL